MSKNTTLIVIIVLLLSLIIGIVVGMYFFPRNSGKEREVSVKTYTLTLDDLYCNIKDSKRILKIKIVLETISEVTYERLNEKQFLIRDEVKKIISNLTEEDLRGENGQTSLQETIKANIIEIFKDENITNVYFNDFIIQ